MQKNNMQGIQRCKFIIEVDVQVIERYFNNPMLKEAFKQFQEQHQEKIAEFRKQLDAKFEQAQQETYRIDISRLIETPSEMFEDSMISLKACAMQEAIQAYIDEEEFSNNELYNFIKDNLTEKMLEKLIKSKSEQYERKIGEVVFGFHD